MCLTTLSLCLERRKMWAYNSVPLKAKLDKRTLHQPASPLIQLGKFTWRSQSPYETVLPYHHGKCHQQCCCSCPVTTCMFKFTLLLWNMLWSRQQKVIPEFKTLAIHPMPFATSMLPQLQKHTIWKLLTANSFLLSSSKFSVPKSPYCIMSRSLLLKPQSSMPYHLKFD